MELQALSPVLQDFKAVSDLYTQRHPVVEIKMPNHCLDLLLNDYKELSLYQQFITARPDFMHEFMKWRTWEELNRK